MITAIFHYDGNCITKAHISGHAEFAEAGEDIVCAAVSSCAIMAANTITEVIGQNGAVASTDEENGIFKIELTSREDFCSQSVLKGLELHITQLQEQYPKNVHVKIKK